LTKLTPAALRAAHRLTHKQSLPSIAKRYRVTVSHLARALKRVRAA
jgi:hypothetical protein